MPSSLRVEHENRSGRRYLRPSSERRIKSDFEAKQAKPFSPAEAIAYIQRLTPEGRAKAAEYVWRAPSFIKTPLREALEREPWFTKPADM
jgi:hypothetical protein